MSDEWSIRQLAASQLGMNDETRLDEVEELSGLLEMIRDGMPRRFESETPPALRFNPGTRAPDFWFGIEARDD